MGSPVAASRNWTVLSSPADRDGAAVGAVGGGLDRTGMLAADPQRMEPRPPRREVEPEGVLEVVIVGDRRTLQAADEPEHALGDVALLAEGLAVLEGQVGCLLIDLPLPRLDFLRAPRRAGRRPDTDGRPG